MDKRSEKLLQLGHHEAWSGWERVQGCSFHARLGMTVGSRVLVCFAGINMGI